MTTGGGGIVTLRRCPNCNAEIPTDLLISFNESSDDYNPKSKQLRCVKCEVRSLKGLWERVR